MDGRRALLRGVGAAGLASLAGVAGCLGVADGDRPSSRSRPADATHEVTASSRDPAPELPIRPRVSPADRYATDGSPPVLRLDVDNDGDEPVTVGEYRAVVFQYAYSDDGALVCLPHSERSTEGEPDRALPDVALADEGCWRLESNPAVTAEYGTVAVPAGGTLTAFVGVYATPEARTDDSCFPTGDRRFESPYTIHPDGTVDGSGTTADWGFTLSVERIGGR